GVGAHQLEVVRAALTGDREGDERIGGADGVGAAGRGGDAGEVMEPVHELLEGGAGDDDVVQQGGDAHGADDIRPAAPVAHTVGRNTRTVPAPRLPHSRYGCSRTRRGVPRDVPEAGADV